MTVKTKERQREGRLGRFMDDPQPRRQVPAGRPQAQPPGPPEPDVCVAPVSEPEPERRARQAVARLNRGKWREQKREQDEVPAGLVYGVIVVIAVVAVVATVVVNCGCSSFF